MLLFGKLVDETQMGNPRDHAVRDIASKFSIFLPLRAIYFRSYRYETPCSTLLLNEGIPRALEGKKLRLKIPRVLPSIFELFLVFQI